MYKTGIYMSIFETIKKIFLDLMFSSKEDTAVHITFKQSRTVPPQLT